MTQWNGNVAKRAVNPFKSSSNYLKFPSSNNNNIMTNIINALATVATTTTAATANKSHLENSSYLYAYDHNNNQFATVHDFDQPIDFGPKRDSLKIVIPLTVVYGLIFITGVIGNISTCIVIKKNRSMHTATNYYLFSLAISDFLLLLSGVPQEIYLTWSKYPYVFGEYFCVGRGILAETSANATVLTITAFTVERYLAICHPFLGQAISKLSRAIRTIVLIWLLSILTAIPQALQFGLVSYQGIERCVVVRIIINHSFQLSTYIFFFAPMSIIFVLYLLIGLQLYRSNVISANSSGGQNSFNIRDKSRFRNDVPTGLAMENPQARRGRFGIKSTQSDTILYRYSGGTQASAVRGRMNQFGTKRVIKMLVAVVICFFLCWAPFHAQRLIAVYGSSVIMAGSEENDGSYEENSNFSFTTEKLNIIDGNASTVTVPSGADLNRYNSKNHEQVHHEIVYTVMTYISGVLYYLSTCINPLLYNLMSNKFRQAFKSILFGKKSSNKRSSKNSKRSLSRKPTTNSSSLRRNSIESELQSKVSLLQTLSNERKMNPSQIIP